MIAPLRMALLAFDGCDAMDLIGPYEVLLTANRLCERQNEPVLFEVLVVGDDEVEVYGGLRLRPHVSVTEVQHVDVLVVPGAIDVEGAHPEDQIRDLMGPGTTVASVCTGAFFLERLGLLVDVEATTHWEDVGDLPGQVRSDVRWVDAGPVITSGGISSGIAMTLHLVERYGDRALAEATARQIDYVWTESR